jgi:DUF3089 family protein
MKASKSLLIIISLVIIVQLNGQSTMARKYIVTDYSDNKNWSIICDSVTQKIDVFFVHPTTYGPPANGNFIANLKDKELNRETDLYCIDRITAAFSKSCNIYAPRYQQMNIEVLSMSDDKINSYLKIPVSDIKAAFKYYIDNYNNGRPFILAGHSQGSDVIQTLLVNNSDLFEIEKIVAAYLPGWTFTDELIKKTGLELATSPSQTGGIIVWNTIGPSGKSPILKDGARCVNPLTWTTDTSDYPYSMNLGAQILFTDNEDIRISNFTSAKINNYGGLEIPMPSTEITNKLNMSMGPDCFHSYDYDFFFYNVEENVSLRCSEYLKNNE